MMGAPAEMARGTWGGQAHGEEGFMGGAGASSSQELTRVPFEPHNPTRG
jgi:hypothetical protein